MCFGSRRKLTLSFIGVNIYIYIDKPVIRCRISMVLSIQTHYKFLEILGSKAMYGIS